MKKILFILRANIETLPPAMSQVVSLIQLGYQVQLVSSQISAQAKAILGSKIEYLIMNAASDNRSNRFYKAVDVFRFRKLVKKALKDNKDSIVWIASADTASYCRDILECCAHKILNIYELYDEYPRILKSIKNIAQSSDAVVVPEYNRAHILKVWLGLKNTPFIVPNKPYFPDAAITDDTKLIRDNIISYGKKVILYQGWIGGGRDVIKVAEALNQMEEKEDYLLVMMGKVVAGYSIDILKQKFSNVYHVPFVSPPQHLFITEVAHIGIATYNDTSLNNIFCAPNKIYEYAYKRVPILARDIPGLENTVGKSNAGICVDFNNLEAIKNAILTIDHHHKEYENNSENLYNTCDILKLIETVVKKCGD